MEPISLSEKVIQLGKQCAVSITGWPEDADDIVDTDIALMAIRECIRLGQESHNKLNQLLYEKEKETTDSSPVSPLQPEEV